MDDPPTDCVLTKTPTGEIDIVWVAVPGDTCQLVSSYLADPANDADLLLQSFAAPAGIVTTFAGAAECGKAYSHLGHRVGDFPVAEQVADECLTLPMYPELNRDQMEAVAFALKDALC